MIIDGAKTVELRRRFVENVALGAIAFIYSSSPKQAVIGYAVIKEVHRLPLERLWRDYGHRTCIHQDDFDVYFSGLNYGYAILLEKTKRFNQSLVISDLRERFGFVPPQSYRYLPLECYALLSHE